MIRYTHRCAVYLSVAGDSATEPVTITFETDSDRPRWRVAAAALEVAQAEWRRGLLAGEPVGARHMSTRPVEYGEADG